MRCQKMYSLVVLFALAVAQSKQGELEEAWETSQRALAAGLPLERFLAGPRELLKHVSLAISDCLTGLDESGSGKAEGRRLVGGESSLL